MARFGPIPLEMAAPAYDQRNALDIQFSTDALNYSLLHFNYLSEDEILNHSNLLSFSAAICIIK